MNKKNNSSFIGITGVHLERSPLGWEISAEFRYQSLKNDVVEISLILPNETKKNFTSVDATQGNIVSKISSRFIIPQWDLNRNDLIKLQGRLDESPSIFSFCFHPEEIVPAY